MQKNQNVLILRGKKGSKIFNQIYNGSKIDYDKLIKDSEKIKKAWKMDKEN